MLQKIERNTSLSRSEQRKPSPAEFVSSLITFLRQQYIVILVTILVMMSLGGLYLFNARPTYTATATLIIDLRKNQLFQQQSVLGDIPIDSSSVESQVQILKSETIARNGFGFEDLNLALDRRTIDRNVPKNRLLLKQLVLARIDNKSCGRGVGGSRIEKVEPAKAHHDQYRDKNDDILLTQKRDQARNKLGRRRLPLFRPTQRGVSLNLLQHVRF